MKTKEQKIKEEEERFGQKESGQGKPGQDDRGPKLGEAEVMKWNGKA